LIVVAMLSSTIGDYSRAAAYQVDRPP
jgi:hypothetical protein